MNNELLERVARAIFLRGCDWPHGVEEEEYTFFEDQWKRMARAVLAELAGELRDAERWHHFREFFGLVDPDDELIIWRRTDIDNCVDKYIDEARGE